MIISMQEIKQSKILIVDDNISNVALLEKILGQQGYKNVSATIDPTTVVPLLNSQSFDLLILDLNMPVMNGYEVMQQIRETPLEEWVPIIVITAQDDPASKIRALSLGAKDFIVKPIDNVETLNRIKNTIEIKLMHHNLRMQNIDLDSKVKMRTEELQESHSELLRALGRAAECKDNEIGNHTLRMARYAQIISMELGFSAQDAFDLFQASPMHDVGKIGIPDSILLKPGKLTPEEFAIMKEHTTIGYNILSGQSKSKLVQLAAQIAIGHHEKWDGSGYPRALKGDDIPMHARIVAIADVFDALTSERPYKPAWTNERAIEHIQAQSGLHFDPGVVDAFLRALPKLLETQRELRDNSAMMDATYQRLMGV